MKADAPGEMRDKLEGLTAEEPAVLAIIHARLGAKSHMQVA
jgi:hypothetical protein